MKRLFRALVLAFVGSVLLVLFFAHPFFAVNGPTGAKVLVVEGWLGPSDLDQVAALVEQRGCTLVYTTGTLRAFRYYLNAGEELDVELERPVEGTPVIQVAGTDRAGFTLLAGTDTLVHEAVAPHVRYFTCPPLPSTSLRIRSWNKDPHADPSTPNIFIRAFKIDGRNVHELGRHQYLIHANGTRTPGRTNEAEYAADELAARGVPAGILRPLPTYARVGRRTLTSAREVSDAVSAAGIGEVDVVTLGVHARRTRKLFRNASGSRFSVGIISLNDPECPAGTWWKMRSGWLKVIKEIVGLRQSYRSLDG